MGETGCYAPTYRGNLVANFFVRHNLTPSNMSAHSTGPVFTCIGPNFKSTLDYIAVSNLLTPLVERCNVIQEDVLNTSDHAVISIDLNISNTQPMRNLEPLSKRIRWDKLSKAERMRQYGNRVALSCRQLFDSYANVVLTEGDLDHIFSAIISEVDSAATRLPRSTYRKHLKPFWDAELDRLKADKIRTYRIWVRARRPRDGADPIYINYKASKAAFRKKLARMS